MSMKSIELLTRNYADCRAELAQEVTALQKEVAELKRRRMGAIKLCLAEVVKARQKLETTIATMPREFERPRTRILHGIKVGIQKGKGLVKWLDEARVVALIKKHLPDQAEVLIKTTETPVKKAIANLAGDDLKRIGVSIEETGDQVVVAPADSEIDKLVDALLKDAQTVKVEEKA